MFRVIVVLLAGLMPAMADDVTSPLVGQQNPASYNGWTEFDRANALQRRRVVTHLAAYSSVPGQWRPKIARRINPHEFGAKSWLVTYRHPHPVTHPGTGWHWVELTMPVVVVDGLMHPGGHFTGFASGTTAMSLGRAEVNADSDGEVTLDENQYETFAMGVRYDEGFDYSHDFTRPDGDGWKGYSVVSIVDGEFRSSGPFTNDFNHDAEIGTLSLLAYRYWEYKKPDGSYQNADFTGARIRARIKFDNWSAPSGTQILLWAQGRIPGTGPNWKFSNWALTGQPLNVTNGQWHEIDVTLPNDESEWTFGGGPSQSYAYASLAATLSNLQDFLIVAVRPVGSVQPTGTVRLDWIRIDRPN